MNDGDVMPNLDGYDCYTKLKTLIKSYHVKGSKSATVPMWKIRYILQNITDHDLIEGMEVSNDDKNGNTMMEVRLSQKFWDRYTFDML